MDISEGSSMMKIAENIIMVLEYIFEKLGIAANWTAGTILPYVKVAVTKYADYKIDKNIFGACSGAALILLGISGIIVISILVNRCDFDENAYISDVLWAFMIIVGMFIIPVCVCNIIKAQNFPELAFAEWVSGLLKSSQS